MRPRPTPIPRDHSTKARPVGLGLCVLALAPPREREHLVVEGARLQPDGGDAEGAGLLEHAAGDGGRGDDAHGGVARVGQVAQAGDGGDVLVWLVAWDGDVWGGGVDGDGWDVVGEVPGEDPVERSDEALVRVWVGGEVVCSLVAELLCVGAGADDGEEL